jgi:ABC-type multidrug transport system ATPase subunit
MFKRVALCQAFLGKPEVVFLDEPTSGLDPENAQKMRTLIQSMRSKQTVVISSHNLREIQSICDYVVVLDKGKLVRADSMESVTSAGHLVRIVLGSPVTDAALEDLRALPGVVEVESTEPTAFNVTLDVVGPEAKNAALKAIQTCLITAHDLIPRSLTEGDSLEARFLDMTGGTYDGAGGS